MTDYTITVTQSSNGTIAPGTTVVTGGASQAFTVTPSANYHINVLTVNSVALTAEQLAAITDEDGVATYTFENVAANGTITSTYAINTFVIVSSAGTGGTISPSGSTTVNATANQAYTITAGSGYQVADVLVDSVSVGAVATYTFTSVTAAHTIAASFTDIPNTMTATFIRTVFGNKRVVKLTLAGTYDTGGIKIGSGTGIALTDSTAAYTATITSAGYVKLLTSGTELTPGTSVAGIKIIAFLD